MDVKGRETGRRARAAGVRVAGGARALGVAGVLAAVGAVGAVGAAMPAGAQEAPSLLDRAARLEVRDVGLGDGLRALQRASGVALAFSPDVVPVDRRVSCACRDVTVRDALDRMLEGTGLRYEEGRRQVLVGRRPPRAPAGSTLVGVVVDAESGRPIPAAEVRLGATGRAALTGDDGRFAIPGMNGGRVELSVTALGYEDATASASLGDDGVDGTRVALERAPIPLEEIVIAPGRLGVLEVAPGAVGVTVSREDIEAIPQFGDDVFRTLKRMPGVSAEDISTKLNVRGGTDRDVLVRLDGLRLFEPYHLKDLDGALGIVDVQSLGSIDLVTGGFPVEYGDETSGIFDMHTRRPPAEGTRTTLGMSLSSLSFISQGTFADGRGQWLTSLRRGFLEYVLAIGGVDDDLSPSFWDALGKVRWLVSDDHVVSAQVLYAGDRMDWRDEETGSRVDSDWTNGYGWVDWAATLGDRFEVETVLSGGRLGRDRVGDVQNQGRGEFTPLASDVDDRSTVDFAGVRQEWSAGMGGSLLLKSGFEYRATSADFDYRAVSSRFDVDDQDRLFIRTDTTAVRVAPSSDEVAAWAALRGRAGSALTWEVGARWDRHTHTGDEEVTPRGMIRWDPVARTSLKASWGRYAQSESVHELPVQDGVSEYAPGELADQVAVGVERGFDGGYTARLEAYHRSVENPFPDYVNLSREVNPIAEVEADRTVLRGDEARARGLELLVAREGTGPLSWSAGYALAWSESRIDGRWVPRTLDQRHTVNLHAAWRLGRDWQLSGSWQYHTGWPFTEQFLDVAVLEVHGQERVNVVRRGFGPINAERLPAYHRLDLRVTRAIQMRGSRLELFLDVFNVYDRTNLRGWEWQLVGRGDGTFRARRSSGEEQLPIMPTIGFRWVF